MLPPPLTAAESTARTRRLANELAQSQAWTEWLLPLLQGKLAALERSILEDAGLRGDDLNDARAAWKALDSFLAGPRLQIQEAYGSPPVPDHRVNPQEVLPGAIPPEVLAAFTSRPLAPLPLHPSSPLPSPPTPSGPKDPDFNPFASPPPSPPPPPP